MKHVSIILLLVLLAATTAARPITTDEAKTVALRWMLLHGNGESGDHAVASVHPFSIDNVLVYRIVNLLPSGVVVVSGDDIAVPVLMYSGQGGYDGQQLPIALGELLDNAGRDILQALREGVAADERIAAMWRELLQTGMGKRSMLGGGGMGVMNVAPLLGTTWNQTFPYNQYCPATSTGGSGGYTYVGCVATAMAQIMKFHNAPATGQGSHSYVHPTYGLQSADFGSTTYQWANMPASINAQSSTAAKHAVAELSYHCGVAVDMDYGPSGSGATIQDARSALVNYFRYNSSASYVAKSSYSASAWLSMLTGELNAGRPVIYRGMNSVGQDGHAFIVDGYQGTDYFHFDFGWGGYLNGYCYLNDITPGSNDFSYYQAMVKGIVPLTIAAPTLATPANNATGVCSSPTLTWNAAAGASSYHVQVSTTSGFSVLLLDDANVTGTSTVAMGLAAGTQHYWRVRASGTAGTSAWTSARSFTTRSVTLQASGPTQFCEGSSVLLSASSTGTVSWSWKKNGTLLPTAFNATLNVTESGSYSAIATENGCATESAEVLVTVIPQPTAAILSPAAVEACEGASTLLEAQNVQGASYQWWLNGSPIQGATQRTWAVSSSGAYTVTVNRAGCESTSAAVNVLLHPIDPTSLTWSGAVNADWSTPGNWDNPCAVPGFGDQVVIPAGVTPPQGIPAAMLHSLSIAVPVSLSGPLTIENTLTLNGASLTLGAHDLVLGGSATIAGAGATAHIITNGSGALKRENLGTGGTTGAVLFPIGSASGYAPALLANSGQPGNYSLRVTNSVLTNGSTGQPVQTDAVRNTWWLDKEGGESNLALTVQWNQSDELPGFARTLCYLARNESTQLWDPFQAPAAAGGAGPFTRSVTGITTIPFGGLPVVVGSGPGLYPVRFLALSALRDDAGVHLRWRTADERGNVGFEILRRVEGEELWHSMGFVPASTSTEAEHEYLWIDAQASPAASAYRLRQLDADGTSTLSAVLNVAAHNLPMALSIDLPHPHPLRVGAPAMFAITLPGEGEYRITMYDVLGRAQGSALLGRATGPGSVRVSFDCASLPAGIYVLHLEHGALHSARTILVR